MPNCTDKRIGNFKFVVFLSDTGQIPLKNEC